jgi:hypothetical protein
MVVQNYPHNPEKEGLNPAPANGKRKWKLFTLLSISLLQQIMVLNVINIGNVSQSVRRG